MLEKLTSYLPLIEKALAKQIEPLKSTLHPLLFAAASHTLLNPGKRIRPLLTLAATESLGGRVEDAIMPACAIEILHTYSLIHDDLPSMDDDDLRRGKPTLHKLYGEGQAILIGDLLLTLAFETLAANRTLSSDKIVDLMQVLAKKAGGEGMILGQSLDLMSEGKPLSWELLSEIHKRKTADLICCCLEFGAIVAGASKETKKVLAVIAEEIGLSFQIIDDVLDVEGEVSIIGKPPLSDASNEKTTSVSLLGLKEAKSLAKSLLASALQKTKSLDLKNPTLEELLPKLIYRLF